MYLSKSNISSAANHRYHTYDYFQVDPILGGNEAFDCLIKKYEEMFIVLDGVFNHCGRGFWAFHHIVENGEKSPYKNGLSCIKVPLIPIPQKMKIVDTIAGGMMRLYQNLIFKMK